MEDENHHSPNFLYCLDDAIHMVYDALAITTILPLHVFRWGSNNLLLYKFIHCQWCIQDLKEGGARSVVYKVCAQKFVAMLQYVDHASHIRFLEDSWLTKKAVLGLVAMRKHRLRSEF